MHSEFFVDLELNAVGEEGCFALHQALSYSTLAYHNQSGLARGRAAATTAGGLMFSLARCRVTPSLKLELAVVRDCTFIKFSNEGKTEEMMRFFRRQRKHAGALELLPQLLSQGLDYLLPSDDVRLLRPYFGQERLAETREWIACPILFALEMRSRIEAMALDFPLGSELERATAAYERLERYAIRLLEAANSYKENWDDVEVAIDLLQVVTSNQKTIFEVAIECGAKDFVAHEISSERIQEVWTGVRKPLDELREAEALARERDRREREAAAAAAAANALARRSSIGAADSGQQSRPPEPPPRGLGKGGHGNGHSGGHGDAHAYASLDESPRSVATRRLLRAGLESTSGFLAFLQRPSTKFFFSVSMQFLCALLSIYVAEQAPFKYELTSLQWVLLVWFAAIAQAEFMQFINAIRSGDLLAYLSDFFNLIDVLFLVLAASTYVLRLLAFLTPVETRLAANQYAYEGPDAIRLLPLDIASGKPLQADVWGDVNQTVLTWKEYKLAEFHSEGRYHRLVGSGEWYLERAADLWGVVAMLVLLRLLHALTLWDRLGPLLVMMRRMLADLFVFIVLYAFFLIGFGIFFMTTFNSTGNERFGSLVDASIYLFYAALGAFDQNEDLEGRHWLVGHGLLMLWLTLSALMMLNLLIAMFADT